MNLNFWQKETIETDAIDPRIADVAKDIAPYVIGAQFDVDALGTSSLAIGLKGFDSPGISDQVYYGTNVSDKIGASMKIVGVDYHGLACGGPTKGPYVGGASVCIYTETTGKPVLEQIRRAVNKEAALAA